MADTTISQLNTISTLSANNFIPISDGTNTTKLGTDSLFGYRNRIINGNMRIDQRNNGAAITITNTGHPWTYCVDRWSIINYQSSKLSVQQNMDSLTPPVGFTNYIGLKTIAPYSIGSNDIYGIHQRIEGNNMSDLSWGTVNAKTVTISFWVRCTKTGLFAGFLDNHFDTRYFIFTYNIISANTWEYKTITIPGDVTGNWRTDNLDGVLVGFYVGAGTGFSSSINTWGSNLSYPIGGANILDTLNAAFYITGVQFEAGPTATPFEFRPIGTELALCQRYYEVIRDNTLYLDNMEASSIRYSLGYKVTKRSDSVIIKNNGGGHEGGSNTFVAPFVGDKNGSYLGVNLAFTATRPYIIPPITVESEL